jgi:hypothetical protein
MTRLVEMRLSIGALRSLGNSKWDFRPFDRIEISRREIVCAGTTTTADLGCRVEIRAGADGYGPAVRLGDLPEPQLGYSGPPLRR